MKTPPFGGDYVKLWIAAAVSIIGDGITLAAAPLFMASLSSNPAVVASAAFAQQLPWLLFSLSSGALIDRLDKRLLLVAVDVARGLVMSALFMMVWRGWASVWSVYVIAFCLGVGATIAENANQALVPRIVGDAYLVKANARLVACRTVGYQFAGPAVGAWLFVLAASFPFGVDAVTFFISAVLIATLRWRPPVVTAARPRRSMSDDIRFGVEWLWHNRPLSALAFTMCLMNIAYGAGFAAFVLYARERLHLSERGFGLLLSAVAVGGLVGTALAGYLVGRVSHAVLLRTGLVVETLTHFALAATQSVIFAVVTLVIFGLNATVWNILSTTIRQRSVPSDLIGRVNSVYLMFSMGGMASGSLLGGLIGYAAGITAPFWAAGAMMLGTTLIVWRILDFDLPPVFGVARA